MEVSGQVHSLVAPEPVWTLWGKEKSFIPAENQNPDVQPVDRTYTDWAILAHVDNDRGNDGFITSVSTFKNVSPILAKYI